MKKSDFDFSGYATKNDLTCTDGRTIRRDAFKDNDGATVPLVWMHNHNEPSNVLGHVLLENRDDGVYVYGSFNDTPDGQKAKKLVHHGDIVALSIYANGLVQKAKSVIHGAIREVSLVMAGANPGALIDNLIITHADGTEVDLEDEAIIYTGLGLTLPEVKHEDKEEPKEEVKKEEVKKEEKQMDKQVVDIVVHAAAPDASAASSAADNPDLTVGEVFDTLTDIQKQVVYALIAEVADAAAADNMSQSDNEGEGQVMKANVFDSNEEVQGQAILSHDQFNRIMSDAQKHGSLRDSVLEHAVEYGIENIDLLFPDAQVIANTPSMISRRMEWVTIVLNSTNHSPFSRIKSLAADLTADEARARGYIKGKLKKDEIIKMLRRVTLPKTIYKKQKLDRDDIIDITDFDVVAWMKAEMRVLLDEELARAILVSDGRESSSDDKIDEANVRPIWKDDDLYAHHIRLDADATVDEKIDAIIRGREVYAGSGSPVLFTTSGFVSDMLLAKDTLLHRLYSSQQELQAVLRVSNIVEVPVMAELSRESDDDVPVHLHLVGIVVNLKDYTVGADKGGQVSMFENFDIDYNQEKYLIEIRVSGALTLPKSALVIEQVGAAG